MGVENFIRSFSLMHELTLWSFFASPLLEKSHIEETDRLLESELLF